MLGASTKAAATIRRGDERVAEERALAGGGQSCWVLRWRATCPVYLNRAAPRCHAAADFADPLPCPQARLSSFVGALALGDLVKSTLGPKGMNKILHSTSTGEITVTNDGATILKSIALDNPAAKILVNISKVQDDEVGDGKMA